MNYFRKYNSYNLNHGYNPRITDIVPDNSSDDLKLRRLSSFRQNNAHSTPQQQQQQYQPLLSSSSFREQSNKILDKWRQTNSGNQKPTDDSTRPVQTQQTNFVLNLDQIMEKDLANQLKKLEIKPKPKIDLTTFIAKRTSIEYKGIKTSYTQKAVTTNKFGNLFNLDQLLKRNK